MPRPCKRPECAALPERLRFGPAGQSAGEPIRMGVDEFETIRLIDLEGLTQEACAGQMQVSRARSRPSTARPGGSWPSPWWRGRGAPHRGGRVHPVRPGPTGAAAAGAAPENGTLEEESIMKIAVTYENGQILPALRPYGEVQGLSGGGWEGGLQRHPQRERRGPRGPGGAAPGQRADTLICGGIGGGAQMALAQAGIRLYGGVSGSADQAVEGPARREAGLRPRREVRPPRPTPTGRATSAATTTAETTAAAAATGRATAAA